MQIRVLNEVDAEAYRAIRLSGLQVNPEAFGSTYEKEANFSLDTMMDRIKPTAYKFVLGAFDRTGLLVGIVTFVREDGVKDRHKGNVFGMYVAPQGRGQGLGKSLMTELISKARKLDGLEQIKLAVVSSNDYAQRLYQSVGFEVYGVERNTLKFNGQYFDENMMILYL